MKEKYRSVGLDLDIIKEVFPNLYDYEEAVNYYLTDEHFKELGNILNDEDYGIAKDMVKGLFLLAQDLRLLPLYEKLLEIYEDLEYEIYEDILKHYNDMILIHHKIEKIFKN